MPIVDATVALGTRPGTCLLGGKDIKEEKEEKEEDNVVLAL
jgi:hypothetical protein